jgi:hypothetical protein
MLSITLLILFRHFSLCFVFEKNQCHVIVRLDTNRFFTPSHCFVNQCSTNHCIRVQRM